MSWFTIITVSQGENMSSHEINSVLKAIKNEEIRFIDLRFTDMKGQEHHFTIPAHQATQELFQFGKLFDGSSFLGWKSIENSDMILLPDPATAVIDPFYKDKTLVMHCDIIEPETMESYYRDPRSLARRAQEYLKSTGIADTAYFGPENEFFVFDDVRYNNTIGEAYYSVHTDESPMNSAGGEENNLAHRPTLQGGYSPVNPKDKLHQLRAEMCTNLEAFGIKVEVHHHEVASAGQCEIGVAYNTLVTKADEVQKLKYVIHNTADLHGKTATFMPKPYFGESGSGMHVHISLFKEGENIFTGKEYSGLSKNALYFIGGLIEHAHALNAFTNASTNSYKRLVPHFEAPVLLAYSAKNRTAAIRIPFIPNPKARRVEVRFPDSTANPYLTFAALLMAGLDGIENKIDPGKAMDQNLYDLDETEAAKYPHVCRNLEEALDALDKDRAFLRKGGVFTNNVIDAYIALKRKEVEKINQLPHPMEYELYYSL